MECWKNRTDCCLGDTISKERRAVRVHGCSLQHLSLLQCQFSVLEVELRGDLSFQMDVSLCKNVDSVDAAVAKVN